MTNLASNSPSLLQGVLSLSKGVVYCTGLRQLANARLHVSTTQRVLQFAKDYLSPAALESSA